MTPERARQGRNGEEPERQALEKAGGREAHGREADVWQKNSWGT